jgi:hypothetical protein
VSKTQPTTEQKASFEKIVARIQKEGDAKATTAAK